MVLLTLKNELAAIIDRELGDEPVERRAVEMIVLELFRRGSISNGRAGELLDVLRVDVIRKASKLGISLIDMTKETWEQEMRVIDAL